MKYNKNIKNIYPYYDNSNNTNKLKSVYLNINNTKKEYITLKDKANFLDKTFYNQNKLTNNYNTLYDISKISTIDQFINTNSFEDNKLNNKNLNTICTSYNFRYNKDINLNNKVFNKTLISGLSKNSYNKFNNLKYKPTVSLYKSIYRSKVSTITNLNLEDNTYIKNKFLTSANFEENNLKSNASSIDYSNIFSNKEKLFTFNKKLKNSEFCNKDKKILYNTKTTESDNSYNTSIKNNILINLSNKYKFENKNNLITNSISNNDRNCCYTEKLSKSSKHNNLTNNLSLKYSSNKFSKLVLSKLNTNKKLIIKSNNIKKSVPETKYTLNCNHITNYVNDSGNNKTNIFKESNNNLIKKINTLSRLNNYNLSNENTKKYKYKPITSNILKKFNKQKRYFKYKKKLTSDTDKDNIYNNKIHVRQKERKTTIINKKKFYNINSLNNFLFKNFSIKSSKENKDIYDQYIRLKLNEDNLKSKLILQAANDYYTTLNSKRNVDRINNTKIKMNKNNIQHNMHINKNNITYNIDKLNNFNDKSNLNSNQNTNRQGSANTKNNSKSNLSNNVLNSKLKNNCNLNIFGKNLLNIKLSNKFDLNVNKSSKNINKEDNSNLNNKHINKLTTNKILDNAIDLIQNINYKYTFLENKHEDNLNNKNKEDILDIYVKPLEYFNINNLKRVSEVKKIFKKFVLMSKGSNININNFNQVIFNINIVKNKHKKYTIKYNKLKQNKKGIISSDKLNISNCSEDIFLKNCNIIPKLTKLKFNNSTIEKFKGFNGLKF